MVENSISSAEFTESSRQDVRPAGFGGGMRRKNGERPRTVPIDPNSVVIMQAKNAAPLDIIDLTSGEVVFPPQKTRRLDLSCAQLCGDSSSLNKMRIESPEMEVEHLMGDQVAVSIDKEISESTDFGMVLNRQKSSFSEGMQRSAFSSEFNDHGSTSFDVDPQPQATGSPLFYMDDADERYDSFSVSQEDPLDSSISPEENFAKKILSMHGLRPKQRQSASKTDCSGQFGISAIKHVSDIAAESVKARIEQFGVERSKRMREHALSRMCSTTSNRHLTYSFLEDSNDSQNSTNIQLQLSDPMEHESNSTVDQKDHLSASSSSGMMGASPRNRDCQSKTALSEDGSGNSDVERLLDAAQEYGTREQQSGGRAARLPDHSRSTRILNSHKGAFTDSLGLGLGGENETRMQSTRPVRERRRNGEHNIGTDANTFNMQHSNFGDELESGAKKLRQLTKRNGKQKTGPKAVFASYDRLVSPHPPRNAISAATSSTQLVSQGKHRVEARDGRNLKPFTDEREEAGDFPKMLPWTAEAPLAKPCNVSGGLTLLAQNAAREQEHPRSHDENTSPPAKVISSSQRHWTAEMFEMDYSRYKREPTEKEKNTIIEHKRLKDRQQDLKTLKRVIRETAKLSCITGFTDVMETEMKKVDEFAKLVLHTEKLGGYKRNRIIHIKNSMIRRQKGRSVAEADIEAALHLVTDPKNLHKITSEMARVEEQIEVVVSRRRIQTNRSVKQAERKRTPTKKVRFTLPENSHSSGGVAVLESIVLGIDAEDPELASIPPKRSSAAYKSKMSEIGIRREEAKEAFWKQKLEDYDNAHQRVQAGGEHVSHAGSMEAHSNCGLVSSAERPFEEQAPESEVSQEQDGSDLYPDSRLRNQDPQMTINPFVANPAQEKTSNGMENSAILGDDVINRLEIERQTEEAKFGVSVLQTGLYNDQICAQAADVGLAQAMHRRRLGIRERSTSAELESDTSEDSNPADYQIYKYTVLGMFYGFEGFEADEEVRLGTFLTRTNAEARVRQHTSDCFHCYMEAQNDVEDEGIQIGTSQDCEFKSIWRRGLLEQTLDFPHAGCRLWVKQQLTTARHVRRRRKAARPVPTYAVRFEKIISGPDEIETETPTYDEVKIYSALELANAEAVRVMAKWYGNFFKDGFLAMQADELSNKLGNLAEGELFEWSDDYRKYSEDRWVEEKMRVWVEEKRAIGPTN